MSKPMDLSRSASDAAESSSSYRPVAVTQYPDRSEAWKSEWKTSGRYPIDANCVPNASAAVRPPCASVRLDSTTVQYGVGTGERVRSVGPGGVAGTDGGTLVPPAGPPSVTAVGFAAAVGAVPLLTSAGGAVGWADPVTNGFAVAVGDVARWVSQYAPIAPPATSRTSAVTNACASGVRRARAGGVVTPMAAVATYGFVHASPSGRGGPPGTSLDGGDVVSFGLVTGAPHDVQNRTPTSSGALHSVQ